MNNKTPNNRTLQTENVTLKFAIVIWKDGCWKYISKNYGLKNNFSYSVKMNKAMTFPTDQSAFNFIRHHDLEGRKYYIVPMECKYKVSFLDYK